MRLIQSLILLLFALAVGSAIAHADVWTDQVDYAPGSTVLIQGDGMSPGENVLVDVLYPDGSLAQNHIVVADETGAFADSYVLPGPDDPVIGTYTVVATGEVSRTVFVTTFDDGHHVEFFYPDNTTDTHTNAADRANVGSVDRGDTLSVVVRLFWHQVGGDSSATSVNVDLSVSSQDDGTTISPWISFSADPVNGVNGGTSHSTSNGQNVTIYISPPCDAVPDTYDGRIQGTPNAGASNEFWFRFTVNNNVCGPEAVYGKTRGYWGNRNGNAFLDGDGDTIIDTGPYMIGDTARGASVSTIATSNTILSGGTAAFNALTGTGGTSLDAGVKAKNVGDLASQVLTLTYNIALISGYSGQAISTLGCDPATVAVPGVFNSEAHRAAFTGLGLNGASTVNAVLAAANTLLNDSVSGAPIVTETQVEAMTQMLGRCVNQHP
jgi:hypothetical protein